MTSEGGINYWFVNQVLKIVCFLLVNFFFYKDTC